jgi:hypothetical protein
MLRAEVDDGINRPPGCRPPLRRLHDYSEARSRRSRLRRRCYRCTFEGGRELWRSVKLDRQRRLIEHGQRFKCVLSVERTLWVIASTNSPGWQQGYRFYGLQSTERVITAHLQWEGGNGEGAAQAGAAENDRAGHTGSPTVP